MDFHISLPALLQFLVLLPAAASCYFAVKNKMRYSLRKTALLCIAVLAPLSFLGAWLCAALRLCAGAILFPALVPLFFLYRRTVTADLPICLAVYVGVCAVQTFPAQFAYALDARLHPLSGAAALSAEAALFQLALACLVVALFAFPACRRFSRAVDSLNFPKIWYFTVPLSSVFLFFNLMAAPRSYSTLHAGRMGFLFPVTEAGALALLTAIYVLFYRGTLMIVEHARLKERSQLLEMQSHQYLALLEHLRQTARLRHDFRHSVLLLASLAEQGDIGSIRTHLAEYEIRLTENTPASYCANAALNALFSYYHEIAVSAGIDTDWRIGLPEPLPVSELDMAALFGNIIENAIDGCRTVPEGSRYFCLTAEMRHGSSLYVVSTNSFDGRIQKGKDGYRSTKHSGNGTGLASIAAVAEKYGGSAQASDNGSEFFVDAVLKL